MNAAVDASHVRPYLLGMGVDPLTFATDLLTAVVIDAGTYDELFAEAIVQNAEGSVLPFVPFTVDQIDRYAGQEPTQADRRRPTPFRLASPRHPARLSSTSDACTSATCWIIAALQNDTSRIPAGHPGRN